MIVAAPYEPIASASVGGACGAALLAAALALLPGWGLVRCLLPDLETLRAAAVAPALSAGLLYVTGELLSSAGVPVGVVLGVALLTAGVVFSALARGRSVARCRVAPARQALTTWAALAGSGLAVLVWTIGIGHVGAVPPNDDGYNHGFMTAQIQSLQSLRPSVLLPPDPLTGHPAAHYYPWALHQQAAVVASLARVDVGLAWTLCSLACACAALPLGVLLLTRRVLPGMPLVSSAAAVLAPLAPSLMAATSTWGGYAMLAGLAVTPGVVELLLVASARPGLKHLAVSSLALAGVLGIHTSEIALVGVLGLVLLPWRDSSGGRHSAGLATRRFVVPFAGAALLLLPVLPQLAAGYQEHAEAVTSRQLPLHEALYALGHLLVAIPPTNPWSLVVAFWVGLLACARVRPVRPWLLAWSAGSVLYLWLAVMPDAAVKALTVPLYSDFRRLAYVLVLVELPVIAYALMHPIERLTSRPLRDWLNAAPTIPVLSACSLVLGLLILVQTTKTSITTVHQSYQSFSLIGDDERAAFRYLAQHVRSDDRVANQPQDGSPWMYSLYGVRPLVTWNSADESAARAQRDYLLAHLSSTTPDPQLDALLARLRITYVYVGPQVFRDTTTDLDAVTLAGSPRLHQVFEAGGARVFAVRQDVR